MLVLQVFPALFLASGMAASARGDSDEGRRGQPLRPLFHGTTNLTNSVWVTVRGSMGLGDAADIFRGPEVRCPAGHYIYGVTVVTGKEKGEGDDTAINAVSFWCSDNSVLESAQGKWGKHDPMSTNFCTLDHTPSRIIDLTLRMEPTHATDATGLVNIRGHCQEGPVFYANDLHWGEWVQPATGCGGNHNFCGFATFVQRPQGRGDDLGIVGIDIECCPNQ